MIGENSLSESVEQDVVESDSNDDETNSTEPKIRVIKALEFMDRVQVLAYSIGEPDMLGSVAKVVILYYRKHAIAVFKQTDIRYFFK